MGKLFSEAIVDMSDAAYTFDYYAGLVSRRTARCWKCPARR